MDKMHNQRWFNSTSNLIACFCDFPQTCVYISFFTCGRMIVLMYVSVAFFLVSILSLLWNILTQCSYLKKPLYTKQPSNFITCLSASDIT